MENVEPLFKSSSYSFGLAIHGLHESPPVETPKYTYGLCDLDRVTRGIHAGQLSVLGARPGTGKTALAEHVALSVSRTKSVLFFTLEMGIERTRERLGAKILRCSTDEYEQMRLRKSHHKQELNRVWSEANGLYKIHMQDRLPNAAFGLKHIMHEIVALQPALAIIDQSRHIDGWLDAGSKQTHIGPTKMVFELAEFARETKTHIMLLSQLRRDAECKRPQSNDLQDTGGLEQAADVVLLLYRPFRGQGNRDCVAEILVAKNRNGIECKTHVGWTGKTMDFHDLTTEESARAECCRKKSKPN